MRISDEPLINQARERFALQDYYGAIHLLQEITEAGRSFADCHHLLGLCYAMLGQSHRALEHFGKALELNPRYIEAHIHRGILLNDLGRTDEAAEAFRLASTHNTPQSSGFPAHVAANLANHHAQLGAAYAESGAIREAIAQYRRAVELGPNFADLRYKLARVLLETGDVLSAREELERVVADRPNFVDALASLGLARFLSGDVAGAQQVWHECLLARPKNARVEAYLSMLERAAE
ncbi:MAG TPA: tetratricopeptide repeat protein [Gemmatimonadales bacterium]|nr:tetratricopeptide repeat protein [Gemmatimonadales bacterium]